MIVKVLFIGDIVGKVGRHAVATFLPLLKEKHDFELVIANGENATHGRGLSRKNHDELVSLGIDVITLGNHYKDRDEIAHYIIDSQVLVRPYNLVEPFPGSGTRVVTSKNGFKFRVTNICGEVFMSKEWTKPHIALEQVVSQSKEEEIHIVDFHAEATAEKQAMGYHFAPRISALLGTHTHVQTRDGQILKNSAAFISDVGMCGPYQSIIGFEPESVIDKMWFNEKYAGRFKINNKEAGLFSAVIIEIDTTTKKAISITPVYEVTE